MSKLEGISPALPLEYDSTDGPYRLNKTIAETVKQNLKNLLLTSPGERVMLPEFGAGLRKILFEPMLPGTFGDAEIQVYEQVARYMSFVNIEDVIFATNETDPQLGLNQVRISVRYNLGSLNDSDTLVLLIP